MKATGKTTRKHRLTASETYAGGGAGTTINLSEHIRQIIREELLRHAAHEPQEKK